MSEQEEAPSRPKYHTLAFTCCIYNLLPSQNHSVTNEIWFSSAIIRSVFRLIFLFLRTKQALQLFFLLYEWQLSWCLFWEDERTRAADPNVSASLHPLCHSSMAPFHSINLCCPIGGEASGAAGCGEPGRPPGEPDGYCGDSFGPCER